MIAEGCAAGVAAARVGGTYRKEESSVYTQATTYKYISGVWWGTVVLV